MCMDVLPHACLCTTCVQCALRGQSAKGSPGTGVTGGGAAESVLGIKQASLASVLLPLSQLSSYTPFLRQVFTI